jgi:hypothetical protein
VQHNTTRGGCDRVFSLLDGQEATAHLFDSIHDTRLRAVVWRRCGYVVRAPRRRFAAAVDIDRLLPTVLANTAARAVTWNITCTHALSTLYRPAPPFTPLASLLAAA